FTFEGHSVVHALQDRQLLRAASSSGECNRSPFVAARPSKTARITFARPLVDISSSPVAMKVGHIVAVSLRQPPQPLHCSRFPTNDSSFAAKASTGSKDNFNS